MTSDRRARFERMYDANHNALLGYALRRTDTVEDAHDVVAEVFLVAWRRLADVPEGDRARLWLYGVARRTLGNTHRGNRRRRALAGRASAELLGSTPPDTSADVDGVAAAAAFHRLSERDREVLLLAGWEGLDDREMAEVLGCAVTTARVRLHRARRRLEAVLDEPPMKHPGEPGHVPGRWTSVRPDMKGTR